MFCLCFVIWGTTSYHFMDWNGLMECSFKLPYNLHANLYTEYRISKNGVMWTIITLNTIFFGFTCLRRLLINYTFGIRPGLARGPLQTVWVPCSKLFSRYWHRWMEISLTCCQLMSVKCVWVCSSVILLIATETLGQFSLNLICPFKMLYQRGKNAVQD